MRVVLVRGYGDVSQLSYGDIPNLKPGPEQVLVRMAATDRENHTGRRGRTVIAVYAGAWRAA